MNTFVNFLKSLSIFNLAVGLLCSVNTVVSATQGRWGWVVVHAFLAFLNLRFALPPEKRWPRRLIP